MTSEAKQVFMCRGGMVTMVGMRKGFCGSDNVVFLDVGADYMAIFTWQKYIRLYTYDMCIFLLCQQKVH